MIVGFPFKNKKNMIVKMIALALEKMMGGTERALDTPVRCFTATKRVIQEQKQSATQVNHYFALEYGHKPKLNTQFEPH